MDGENAVEVLEDLGVNVHGKKIDFKGYSFIGCGGSTTTPFGTPFELDENIIFNCLKEKIESPKKTVIICHTPPYKTKTDRTMFGVHVGSKKLRKLIEEKKPLCFLCGHIHESASTDFIGGTLILNPGPFRRGGIGFVEIEVNEIKGRIEKV